MALVTKNFSDIITFTRASTGTFFDSAGVLTSAATNAPRFDYNPSTLAARGLLIEESRANSLTYSEDFGNAAWTKALCTISANSTTAPDGTTTADTIVEDTTSGFRAVVQTFIAVANTTYSISFFIKPNTRTFVRLYVGASGSWATAPSAVFNLSNGTVDSGTGSIISLANGWYRCAVTGVFGAVGGSTSVNLGPVLTAGGTNNYLGTGANALNIWGAQLEAGAFPTSYIPTTVAQVTRNADVASVNTLSPWYNSASGTLYVEGQLATGINPATPAALVSLDDTTLSNRMQLRRQSPGTVGDFRFVSSGGNFTGTATVGTLTGINKQAAAYAVSDQSGVVNGTLMTGITPIATLPTITRLALGDGPGSVPLNGWLRRVTFYPRRLSNAELQALTV
jgi:hypothetical protein